MQPAPLPVQRRVFSGASVLMLLALCLTLFSPFGVPLAHAAPLVVLSPSNGSNPSTRPVFFGTATPGASITVGQPGPSGSTFCSATADAITGDWSCQVGTALTSGSPCSIVVFDGSSPIYLTITPDSTIPDSPVITSVADPTNISGTGLLGHDLFVYDIENGMPGNMICSVAALSGSSWSCTPSPALGVGSYRLSAYMVDTNVNPFKTSLHGTPVRLTIAPTITSLFPTHGPAAGNTPVTISGTNLGTITGVAFGGTAGGLNFVSALSLSVLTPPGTAGTVVTVVVTDTSGITTTFNGFTYDSANADLSDLTLSGGGTLSPTFDAATQIYTASVPYTGITLTVTPTVSDTNATVAVSGTTVLSGNASDAITLTLGANVIPVRVTAQDGTTTKPYTVTVTRAAASINADLSNLTLSSGTLSPTFAAGTTDYTATVGYGVNSLTVTPIVSDTTATVKVKGVAATSGSPTTVSNLVVGTNIITTVVTAQNAAITKTYTITVTRTATSANADLSNLTLSSGPFTPTFDAATQSYTATVPYTGITLTVTPTVSDTNATVAVSGTTVLSGNASDAITLTLGANVIPVRVTAQDGTTTKPYTVTVTRAAASINADLSNLTLSSGTLSPTFAAGTTSYTATVPYTAITLTVTPTLAEISSSVTVSGTTVASGSASRAITLTLGANVIPVVVTAQNTAFTKTYTITITRLPSSNAYLSNLTLSTGTLSPTFASTKTSYTVAVSTSVASLTVTPTVSDTNATVKVNGVSATTPISLSIGVTRIIVQVTAADGTTTKNYLIYVTRAGTAEVELSQSYKLEKGTGATAQAVSLAAITNTLTLTITVRNNGPDAVTGVVIADTFPTAAISTTWTWTCVGAGGGVCGNASGTGNLNEALGLLPVNGSVTFVVKGSLLNPNNWKNAPSVTTPTGVVDTTTTNNSITVGNFMTFVPLVVK